MAKKKNYWYVLVLTGEGAKFVTSMSYRDKTAYWDKLEVPKELGMETAKDLAMGLMLNGHLAYAVTVPYELDCQPYSYKTGHFEWVKNEEE